MKIFIVFIMFALSSAATADTIKKWVDETGKVHYGNSKDADYIDSAETLKIRDTFDQKEYDAGLARHKEDEKIGAQYERERAADKEKKRVIEEKKATKPIPPGGAPRPYPTPAKKQY